MKPTLFPAELRTISVVPRWSIIHVLTRDTVSNHSYFVAIYARSIAKLIEWSGDLGDLLFMALVHDAEETISGDIPGPIKQEILDDQRAAEYIDLKMQQRLGFIVSDLDAIYQRDPQREDEAWRIIKAADRLDALIFMITELRLGNGIVAPYVTRAWAQTEAAFRALPAHPEQLDRLWATVMVAAIREHETSGSIGIL